MLNGSWSSIHVMGVCTYWLYKSLWNDDKRKYPEVWVYNPFIGSYLKCSMAILKKPWSKKNWDNADALNSTTKRVRSPTSIWHAILEPATIPHGQLAIALERSFGPSPIVHPLF